MHRPWLAILCIATFLALLYPMLLAAQTATAKEQASFARIAILRPNDGDTVEFEAGYIRHLDWHRQAKDSWRWYGWTVWAGERQRWFLYATFGHSAVDFDNPVSPAEDERDNISNVTPHAQYLGNAVYEFLPALSRGTGEPQPTARLELTTVDVARGMEGPFETALAAEQSKLGGETLWYRMLAGGASPRYVRLRPRPSVSAILEGASGHALPPAAGKSIVKATVEILNLRPAMCYGVAGH